MLKYLTEILAQALGRLCQTSQVQMHIKYLKEGSSLVSSPAKKKSQSFGVFFVKYQTSKILILFERQSLETAQQSDFYSSARSG